MGLGEWFNWASGTTQSEELPNVFPVPILQSEFVAIDIVTIYAKILTDVIERTQGLKDEQQALLWDNCVRSSKDEGLITLLSKAMADKQDLFLVYEKGVNVLRLATNAEAEEIKKEYEKSAKSSKGVWVSFKHFKRADMVKLYSGLEYCTVAALYKSMNLSKAIQFKMSELRKGVSLIDSAGVKAQAQTMARALNAGRDVLMDGEDTIETATPDLTATNSTVDLIAQKLGFYLGLPAAYITGEQTGGLGTTGENDTKAIERGLKSYFVSVVKPVIEAVFAVKLTYKSQDFRQIAGAMEVVKTFALVDDQLVSADNKRQIINGMLDLPPDAKGDAAPKVLKAELPAPPPAKGTAPRAEA